MMSDAKAASDNGYGVSDLDPRDGQRKFKTLAASSGLSRICRLAHF